MRSIKREFGVGLILAGMGFAFASKTMTGAVIGSYSHNFFGVIGVMIFILGLIFTYSGARENYEYMQRESKLKEMLGNKYGSITEKEKLLYNKSLRRHEERLNKYRVEETPEESQKKENLAEVLKKRGYIPTKSRELLSIAKKLKYDIKIGGDGYIVRDEKGKKITEIGKHREIPRGTARHILEALAEGEFHGRKTA
jgi:hypothetical protein